MFIHTSKYYRTLSSPHKPHGLCASLGSHRRARIGTHGNRKLKEPNNRKGKQTAVPKKKKKEQQGQSTFLPACRGKAFNSQSDFKMVFLGTSKTAQLHSFNVCNK